MRCKKCGGIVSHIITDITGQRFFRCTRGLTVTQEDIREGHIIRRSNKITLCGEVYDEDWVPYDGLITFNTGGEIKTVSAQKLRL